MSSTRTLPALLFLLLLAACGGGGGGDDDTPFGGGDPLEQPPAGNPGEAPAIERTIPLHATLNVARNAIPRVEFAVPIDPTSVRPDSIGVEGPAGTVSGETRRIGANVLEFVPDDDLPYGVVIQATLHPGIRDLDGHVRDGAYVFAFRTVEAAPRAAALHEFEPNDMRVYGLAANRAGDGLSVMFESNGTASGLRFRRVRGGLPVGPVGDIVAQAPGAHIPRRTLDVAENGNGQYAWLHPVNGKLSAFIRGFNRAGDSWGSLFELTPDAGVLGVTVDAELNDHGGLVSWMERDDGQFDDYRVYAGRYEDGTGLFDVVPLGAPTGVKGGLVLSRRGTNGVVAFHADDGGSYRAQAGRFSEAGGFQSVQLLDGANVGFVRAAQASPSGHSYVLFEREDPADDERGRWYLAVANPGQGFGPALPLHPTFEGLGGGAMAVGANGVLTVLYSVSGDASGTWVRRYTPGHGLSQPVEMTGLGRPVTGSLTFDALTVEANAKGDAVAVASVGSGQGQTIRGALLPVLGSWTVGIELADEPQDRPTTRQAKLVIEPSGGALVQWTSRIARSPDPLHYVLRVRRIRTDGSLSPVTTYNATPAEVIASTFIAMNEAGRGLILFSRLGDNAGGPDDVVQALIH